MIGCISLVTDRSRQMDRRIGIWTAGHAIRDTEMQTDRQTDQQIYRQTSSKTHRQTDRERNRETGQAEQTGG